MRLDAPARYVSPKDETVFSNWLSRLNVSVAIGAIFGACLALSTLVGRWGFDRLLGIDGPLAMALEIRWLLAGTLFTLLLIKRVVGKTGNPTKHQLSGILILTVFLGYLACSALWSPSPSSAFIDILDLALLLIFCFFARMELHGPAELSYWRSTWILCSFLGALGLIGAAAGATGRLTVLAGGPNTYGRIMGLLTIVSLHNAMNQKKLGVLILNWAGVVVGLLLVGLSGSRGALVSTAVASTAYMCLALRERPRQVWRVIGIAIGALVIGMVTPLGAIAIEQVNHRLVQAALEQGDFAGRGELYAGTLQLIQKAPFLGFGLGSFASQGSGFEYPHNLFLEVLVDGGIVGLMFLGLFMAYAFSGFRGPMTANNRLRMCALLLFFVAAQVSGDIYDNRNVFILAMLGPIAFLKDRHASKEGINQR